MGHSVKVTKVGHVTNEATMVVYTMLCNGVVTSKNFGQS